MYPFVSVEWKDSHTENDWKSVDDAISTATEENAVKVLSSGFLIHECSAFILIAGSISAPTSNTKALVNSTMQIPRECVVSLKYLMEKIPETPSVPLSTPSKKKVATRTSK